MTATSIPGSLGGAAADPAKTRATRLGERVKSLQTKATTEQVGQILMIAGGILMPLGLLLIILGWVGASRTPLPFEQNDYLISGGILGLALVVGGGFCYFAYWQTVRIRESRHQSAELTAVLRRLEGALTGTAVAAGTPTRRFVATASGSMFHRPDCATVANREDLIAVDADRTALRPCRICTPLDG
jgi:hypothetical protein